ncbi:EGF domain-specific O-linked N-acetylglucosamine transferase isoform X3 [Bombus pyrosoma]|uniref:EGF domain-specific O-linked N-acetylglucosamine transferase isoform X3 n=1 Tax=Bombus pyrosoma TaxID=396416 RepID=UPI001CB935B9|nr:EGF domain-specific O-linked N-acetylglucosamine transferase isoform X3 [Bombus pyrosoma]
MTDNALSIKYSVTIVLVLAVTQTYSNYTEIDLPPDHIKYYFDSFPTVAEECRNNTACPYKGSLDTKACWGYEPNCKAENSFSVPQCPGDHRGWVTTKKAQVETFYAQGDFGYVRDQRKEMSIFCKPLFVDDSSLECSEHMRFCRARNIMINFTDLIQRKEPIRYKMDVLKEGQIGGYCTYRSAFQDAFQAFTRNPLWDLHTFRGETVCFKNLVFPLLPRMIFGLYYNTPLIYGCEKSGLFKAFGDHVLHRLRIPHHERKNQRIRVTLLSRDTQYRRILNEDELTKALKENPEYKVRKVVYNKKISFKKQLEITRNSDIFIGIHGAGLTHLMFLPDWAAVFEIYNCEDPGCYKDLARLRGVKYFTWENASMLVQQDPGTHPDGGAHAKFTNYSFDVKEFLRIVSQATDYVKNHDLFKKFISGRLQHKRTGTKNQTRTTSDVNATPKSKKVTDLKSDIQSKDEL